ncbi:adenylyltransferase/cytidyltransferase family protein [Pseudomonas sp. BBP2017]|uniref:adenylyltransferase/cytidyltransferase family protein n=1 Tax=Pseudomonas sp. BBP2017 TaxID=2109731 RepID=UPI001304FB02|nr:adenylyltransferase/cytidyltransferase family protein [Pseudomonas sp. BBP2017]
MSRAKMAVYGGAFNPPHAGHAQVMTSLLSQAERVLVVPSFSHPFGKQMVDFDLRIQWLEKILGVFSEPRLVVDTCERELFRHKSPIFSIDLLRFVADRFSLEKKDVALVMGEDNQKVLHTFYGYQAIMDEFSVITMPETINVHSTMIRDALKAGGDIPSKWMAPGLRMTDYLDFADTGWISSDQPLKSA